MASSSEDYLRRKLIVVWVPSLQGMLVAIYDQKNRSEIGFPTLSRTIMILARERRHMPQ